MTPQKPLLLKDYLKLDPFVSDSCSGSAPLPTKKQAAAKTTGTGYTTVRFLLEAERTGGATLLLRSRSKNTLSKISVLINAVKNLTSPTRSKKRSPRFWKKKKEEEDPKITVSNSFSSLYYCPSPVVSSCCESDTSSTDHNRRRQQSESQTSSSVCQSEEEKEQLSPVSVMDFPYDEDEDEGKDNENFKENLATVERTTHHILQKIRRFESLAPVDLAQRFEDDDSHVAPSGITAWHLIRRLRSDSAVGPHEKLLLDFFVEELSWSKRRAGVDELLSTAEGWIDGGGCLNGEDQLKETERNGRWGSFEDGRDDVAADVEERLLGSLLHELVLDLVCC